MATQFCPCPVNLWLRCTFGNVAMVLFVIFETLSGISFVIHVLWNVVRHQNYLFINFRK